MASQIIPSVKLNSNQEIPTIGLGTWKANPEETIEAVKNAIDAGYRFFDTAYVYGNERELGQAIKSKIDEGVVTREELVICTKLWATFHSRQAVIPALKQSLSDLGTDYLDLYLVHGPFGLQEGGELVPTGPDGSPIFSDVDYLETWEGMEEAVDLGLTKSIGVSNFNHEQLERLLNAARIPPAVNQVEVSPYFSNTKLVDFCSSKGVAVIGYSCFGSSPIPGGPGLDHPQPEILQDELLQRLAIENGKSVAQIILRWAIQRNIIVIPKSISKNRIESNINIFDFTLTAEQMDQINELNKNSRTVTIDWAKLNTLYPFNIEY
jgi:aldehyde reductase